MLRDDVTKEAGTAYHEAGHAVVAWALGFDVTLVTIEHPLRCVSDLPEDECDGAIMLCFAGQAAAAKHGSRKSEHGWLDMASAVEINQRYDVSDERRLALIDKTHELVAQHWPLVERLAQALIERRTLHANEIEALLNPKLSGPS